MAAVAQLNGLQASLCALVVYAAQELVLISFVLKADVGIFFFDGGSKLKPQLRLQYG